MNREIKFRGKSISTGKWLYGCLLKNEEGKFAVVKPFKVNMDNECSCCEVEEETIGQFTGLYDRNQKPIYEGDIVQWEECVADYTFIKQKTEVFYSENSASFEPLNEFNYCDFEVIGNIHDNKDLLNEI